MAITLPAPPIPIEQPAAQIRALGAEQLRIDYGDLHLHVHGLHPADAAQLLRDLQATDSLGDALLAIANRYYLDGWPAVRVTYALNGSNDIEIGIVAAHVLRVDGAPRLQAYFADLPQHTPLRAAALEYDRSLAEVAADRAGEQYSPRFVPAGPDAVMLDLGPSLDTLPKTSGGIAFSDAGNRYAGPYLASGELQHSFAEGAELGIAVDTALPQLGDAQHFHDVSGSASQITPYGLFGLEVQQARFQIADSGTQYSGRLSHVSLSWDASLYADFDTRLNLRLQFDQQGESVATADGELALRERYGVPALTLHDVQRFTLGDHALQLDASLALRKGLGPSTDTLSAANLSFWVLQPAIEWRYQLRDDWTPYASAHLQLASATLPQQEQLLLGGADSLQAYQAGSAVGDRGQVYALGVEWQALPQETVDRASLNLRLYSEYASARLASEELLNASGRISASDLGISAIAALNRTLSAQLSLAVPLSQTHAAADTALQRRSLQFVLRAGF